MPDEATSEVDPYYTKQVNHQFRTITTMLRAFHSHKHQNTPGADTNDPEDLKIQRRILSALATLFVKNREVVAVTWRSEPQTRLTLVTVAAPDISKDVPIEYIAVENAPIMKVPTTGSSAASQSAEKHVWHECTTHAMGQSEDKTPYTLADVLEDVYSNKSQVEE